MALVHVQLLLLVEIVHAHPRIAGPARDEAALFAVQRDAGHLVGGLDALDEAARVEAVEEVGAVTRRDAQDAGAGAAFGRKGVEFATADNTLKVVFADGRARAQVPPADFLVVGGGDEDVEVRAPDDGLDGAAVDARADFIAGGCAGVAIGGRVAHAVGAGGRGGVAVAAAREVEDAEFLLSAAGGEHLRAGLGGERDGADDVCVLEGVEAFASVGVPYFAKEEGRVSMKVCRPRLE